MVSRNQVCDITGKNYLTSIIAYLFDCVLSCIDTSRGRVRIRATPSVTFSELIVERTLENWAGVEAEAEVGGNDEHVAVDAADGEDGGRGDLHQCTAEDPDRQGSYCAVISWPSEPPWHEL